MVLCMFTASIVQEVLGQLHQTLQEDSVLRTTGLSGGLHSGLPLRAQDAGVQQVYGHLPQSVREIVLNTMMINTSLLDNHVFLFNVYYPIFKSKAHE